jgi:tetratricopeptide (TPR) repeat protein
MLESVVDGVEGKTGIDRRGFLRGAGRIAVGGFFSLPKPSLVHERVDVGYTPRYHTVAHEILGLEKELGATDDDYRLLDSILDEARVKIKVSPNYTKEGAIEVFRAIDSILKGRGFEYGKTNLLNRGLKNKELSCNNDSIINVAIGEVLRTYRATSGLPIVAVSAPGHMFVRWDSNGRHDANNVGASENEGDVNWETTSDKVFTDNFYRSRLNIADMSVDEGVFLRSLSRDELLSFGHQVVGFEWKEGKRLDRAIGSFHRAIQLNPVNVPAHNNEGVVWGLKGESDRAIASYTTAIGLSPNDYIIYANRADVFDNVGRLDEAAVDYTTAIGLNPPEKYLEHLYLKRSAVWAEKGNRTEWDKDLNKAAELRKKRMELQKK